jgi:hypothetical protein
MHEANVFKIDRTTIHHLWRIAQRIILKSFKGHERYAQLLAERNKLATNIISSFVSLV